MQKLFNMQCFVNYLISYGIASSPWFFILVKLKNESEIPHSECSEESPYLNSLQNMVISRRNYEANFKTINYSNCLYLMHRQLLK